ncbi:MAG: hypothetical protein Ta2B_26230 [Termitinemataceae bacterium]|nr:MAG: hypothetical protein Ta2B_26230 [Termitinemataceae bacterium]
MNNTKVELKCIVGINLRKHRDAAGLSQQKLAAKAKITVNFVHEIEHGKRGASMETIANVSRVLGIEPYKLFLPEWEKSIDDVDYPEHIETFLKSVEDLKRHYQ